jgi:hypothetical protein
VSRDEGEAGCNVSANVNVSECACKLNKHLKIDWGSWTNGGRKINTH